MKWKFKNNRNFIILLVSLPFLIVNGCSKRNKSSSEDSSVYIINQSVGNDGFSHGSFYIPSN